MQILQNRRIAVLGMVVLIIVACLLGPGKYLKKSYTMATEKFREDILHDIDNMTTSAGQLITIATDYSESDTERKNLSGIISDVNAAVAKLDISAICKSKSELIDAAEALSAKLDNCKLSETDASLNSRSLSQILGSEQRLEHGANGDWDEDGAGYNELAQSYNNKQSAFPGSLFAGIVGYSTLPLYA